MRFVSDVEQGRANISVIRLHHLASALEITLASLVRPDAQAPRLVTLLGVRGSGKSTIGPLLARALNLPFVELAHEVEGLASMSAADIFELHGESYYHRLERQCLEALVNAARPCVTALPGGVVTREDTFDLIRSASFSVWLKAGPEHLWSRVFAQGDTRPMAGRPDAMAELRALLARREPLYQQCDLVIDTTMTPPKDAVTAVLAAIPTLPTETPCTSTPGS